MTRLEVSFDDYDAECLTFLTEHFDAEGEHVAIRDFPRYEELGREHVMKVIDRYCRYQMIEFLDRGTITILPQLLSNADQLRAPVDSESTPFSENEAKCLERLSELFQSGTTQTSVNELFANMDVDNGQKHAICESLKASGAIKPTYQLGQQLPYAIQILPNVVKQHRQQQDADQVTTRETPRTAWDTIYGIAILWFGDPNARFAKFFAVAGVALIAAPWWQPVLQQLAVKYLGIPETFLANADNAMFWSGWLLIAIALGLYIWIKRLQHQNNKTAT